MNRVVTLLLGALLGVATGASDALSGDGDLNGYRPAGPRQAGQRAHIEHPAGPTPR